MKARLPEIEPVLAQTTFFAGLTKDDLRDLASSVRLRKFARGQFVFSQGDRGDTLYIIESGEVKITLSSADGKEIMLALLGRGDCFGELAVLDGEPRSADAVVKQDCQLVLLHKNDFQRFLQAHPAASASLLAALSRRLRRTDQLIHDVAFLDIRARLARTLLTLAETNSIPQPGGLLLISSRITQSELADMAGATRESINQWLRYYQKQGLVRCERGRITLLNPGGLRIFLS